MMSEQVITEIEGQHKDLSALIERIAAEGMPADARVIYRSRNVVAVISTPTGDINVKQFRRPRPINSLIYTTFRQSKARRSFEFATTLMEKGIGTPAPVAFIEKRRGGRLTDSYYLSEQINAEEFRFVERRPDERQLLEALGREMVRLHAAGILMLDFSPGNILFTGNAEDGYRFSYVDLNRTRFDVTDHSALMEMFRSIVVEPRQVEIIAAAYAEEAGIDRRLTVADALRRHARFQNFLARKRKLKHLLMPWKKKYQ